MMDWYTEYTIHERCCLVVYAGSPKQSSELERAGKAVCPKLCVWGWNHKATGVLWGTSITNYTHECILQNTNVVDNWNDQALKKKKKRENEINSTCNVIQDDVSKFQQPWFLPVWTVKLYTQIHLNKSTQSLFSQSCLHMCLCVYTIQADSFKVDQELAQNKDSFKSLLSLSEKDRLSMDSVVQSEIDADLVHVLLTEKDSERAKTDESVRPLLSSVNSPGTNLENPTR